MKVLDFFYYHFFNSFIKKETINKENVTLTLFIGSLEVLRIKQQKNETVQIFRSLGRLLKKFV